jgi:small subunit ribosomal protein S9
METVNAVGRRKDSIARIYLAEGKGNITINNRDFKEYFPVIKLQSIVEQPLTLVDMRNKFDIKVNVNGGGINGQAEALQLGIARALEKYDPELRNTLKEHNTLRRDPRQVERKKPGRPKARKRFQYSKR